jgi:hypothetical protein
MNTESMKYTLQDKQLLIRDALRRMDPLHIHWRMLEGIYRTGLRRELNSRDFADLTPTPIPGNVLKTINMTLPHISLMSTSIVSRDPQMLVTPLGGTDESSEDNAVFALAVLHYFWKRTQATDDVKSATEDMLKLGNGFVKVGWEYMKADIKNTPQTPDDEIMKLADLGINSGFAEATYELEAEAPLTYEHVLVDEAFVEYVSPYDIFLPKDSRRMNTARWVAQRLRLPVADLKQKFGKDIDITVDVAVASDAVIPMYNNNPNNVPEVLTYAIVYEFYDMLTKELSVFQLDGEALYEGPIPYQHRYPPFVHFRNYNDGGMQFWAFGDLENIAGIQLLLGEVVRAQVDDLKRSGNKYAIRKKHATPDVKKQLESPVPDQVVMFDVPETQNLQDIVVPLPRQATPSDAYSMDAKLQDSMQKVLGMNDFQTGGMGTSRMAATTAAVVDGVATLRAQDKLAAVENGISEIGQRILMLCQEFLDDDRAIRIAGSGGTMWLNVSPSDIFGEFKVSVEGGSTRALNPATRAQRGIQTIQIVVPTLQGLGYDPENAIKMALRDMGYDPAHLMIKMEQPAPAPEQAPMPPEMMGAMPVEAMPAPAEQVQQEFGGPGVPGATNGTIQL